MSTNPFQIQYKIRNAMILALRDIFSPANNPPAWKYPYIENAQGMWDFDNSKIFIGDIIPQDNAALPSLVVDSYSGNETRYLGPEDQNQVKNSFNVVTEDNHFASITSTVTINIYTIDDTIARDQIIDTIYDHFKNITHQLAINGIEIIQSHMPSETRVMQDNRWWITNRIIIDVYSEWVDTPLPIVNVSGIGVNVPVEQNLAPIINSPLSASYQHGVTFIVDNIIGSNLITPSTMGLTAGDHITQGSNSTTITSVGLPFTISSVVDSTHLTVSSTSGMYGGDTIIQGLNSTAIVLIVDSIHLIVSSTTGFSAGSAVDVTHYVLIGSTTGWVEGPALDTSVNLPFNYIITATNSPTSYAATGLPSGLSLPDPSNGLITGIPTATGSPFYITLSATNATGTGTQSLTLTVS